MVTKKDDIVLSLSERTSGGFAPPRWSTFVEYRGSSDGKKAKLTRLFAPYTGWVVIDSKDIEVREVDPRWFVQLVEKIKTKLRRIPSFENFDTKYLGPYLSLITRDFEWHSESATGCLHQVSDYIQITKEDQRIYDEVVQLLLISGIRN